MLGSPVIAASVVGVVVIPVVITPAVLVVATASAAVETCIEKSHVRAGEVAEWIRALTSSRGPNSQHPYISSQLSLTPKSDIFTQTYMWAKR